MYTASPHAVCALSSCAIPSTVKGLHSFIGAYKALAWVIPASAIRIAPLDALVASRESSASFIWTEEDHAVFHAVQGSLSSHKAIVMPVPSDKLWIVPDAATSTAGIGAIVYVRRRGKTCLAGFFSVRLKPHQATWLPCEVCPTLAPTSSSLMWAALPSLTVNPSSSSSSRVSTFLSVWSRYNVALLYLAGASNVPADFASRNAAAYTDDGCHVCKFVSEKQQSVVVRAVASVSKVPDAGSLCTSCAGWLAIHAECGHLRQVRAQLSQSTWPSKKVSNSRDVKRYSIFGI